MASTIIPLVSVNEMKTSENSYDNKKNDKVSNSKVNNNNSKTILNDITMESLFHGKMLQENSKVLSI